MKIDTLQLKHTLHFADLKLKFNDQPITLIMGDQGTGKTTILKFTYQALTWFAARYKDLRAAGVVMPRYYVDPLTIQNRYSGAYSQ